MTTYLSCGWCHAMNPIAPGQLVYCSECGHRADVARMQCDCKSCLHPKLPEPGLSEQYERRVIGHDEWRTITWAVARERLSLEQLYAVWAGQTIAVSAFEYRLFDADMVARATGGC